MQDYQITIPANLFFIPGGVSTFGVPNNFNIDLWAGYMATSFVLFIIISNAIPERQLKHPLPFEKFKIKVYLPEKL
ncbi:hypothetical protein RhiirA5_415445 [Rhizophagus irregularis]|uniref:Uncharacterized protein n=1 Tax=Rhizophagus irregularis TaxID=588596 RepID=A0A2I1E8R9_9GLOM|nr:hypothetical protein RhiirA5_415445 [Rhizophagus irregularis]GBC24036.1 hypothetical protein RIR_jg399.t1 [Rhizophagus irregularis DAOM 181602=DAOM 197198]PKC66404.1 hypothetical protein RhiirA1_459777 [Rhizophagus irregularis]PKY18530.1 hypothetical protein RhiirB3_431353 [Rhizophagus irregularis]UZO17416.1 hypothetical protein OCT59_008772 [Rhizophagus irregularis]